MGYNSLASDSERTLYRRIDNAANNFVQKGNDITPVVLSNSNEYVIAKIEFNDLGLSEEEAIKIYYSYDYDHPAYYWISNELWSSSNWIYLCTTEDYAKGSVRNTIDSQVILGVKSYAKYANCVDDTLDKIAVIHDLIASDVEYAYSSTEIPEKAKWAHSVQGVFDDHKAVVCEGYADAFSLMMNYLDIPNYYIVGNAGSGGSGGGGPHAWNAVSPDGGTNYMYMDVTWDDIDDGGYYYQYFGMPKSDFENSHFKKEPSGTGVNWLYELTGNFYDDVQHSYYEMAGLNYTGGDAKTFADTMKVRTVRIGDYITFICQGSSEIGKVMNALGISGSYSYYPLTYSGIQYYCISRPISGTVNLSSGSALLTDTIYRYTGSPINPEPSVSLYGVKLIKDRNYTLSYTDNTSVGDNAKVTANGNGNFSGSCSAGFTISDDGSGGEVEDKSKLSLDHDSLSFTAKNETSQLKATVLDTSGEVDSSASVTFESDDPSVASVTSNGQTATIKAVSSGTAKITAKSGKHTKICNVSVNISKAGVPQADKEDGATLAIGSKVSLSSATSGAVIYYTLDGTDPDENSTRYSSPIEITDGMASKSITIKTIAVADGYDDSDIAQYTYSVSVSNARIELSETSLTLKAGESETLIATVYKDDDKVDTRAAVSWESDDDGIATVNNGRVTGISKGTAKITATSGELTAECAVEVEMDKTAAPEADHADKSELMTGDTVSLSSRTTDAVIYYTTDGSEPTEHSTRYTAPIAITQSMVGNDLLIKAFAVAPYKEKSETVTFTYTVADRSGIRLSDSEIELNREGETKTLKATVYDVNGEEDKNAVITWKSSDDKTATVDNSGKVTAVKDGTAVITAESSGISAECKVTVSIAQTEAPVAELDSAEEKPAVGDKITLTCDTDNAKIYYTLDNSDPTEKSAEYKKPIVIEKDMAGKDLTVKAIAKADGYKISTVTSAKYAVEDKSAIHLNMDSIKLTSKEDTVQLEATVLGVNGKTDPEAEVTWTSSDEGVAEVDENGVVKPVADGNAVITAEYGTKSDKCRVIVSLGEETEEAAEIVIDPESLSFIKSGISKELKVTVKNEKGEVIEDAPVSFTSDDPDIAVVNNKGLVTSKESGETFITVKSGNISKKCRVEVLYNVKFYVNDKLYTEYNGIKKGDVLKNNMPADPEGDFIGWTDRATGAVFSASSPITGNLKLDAKFSEAGKEEQSAFNPLPDTEASDLYLVKGQSFTLTDLENGIISDDPQTLNVTKAGRVTAKKAGIARLTDYDYNVLYNAVIAEPCFDRKKVSIICGEETELTLTLKGAEDVSSKYPVLFTSSMPAVAGVQKTDEGCRVNGLSKGSAKITAYINGKAYTCTVNVSETKGVKLTDESSKISLSPMQSIQLKLRGKSFKNVTWTSDNDMKSEGTGTRKVYCDGIAYITSAGKLTAVGPGKTVLHCVENGVKIELNVAEPVEKVVYMNTGKKQTLKFNGVKSAAAIWKYVENAGVIDKDLLISKNGTVKGLKPGSATVTCEYDPYPGSGNGFTYTTRIYVENPALNTDKDLTTGNNTIYNLSLYGGDTYKRLSFVYDDDYKVYQPVLFTSSNPAAAYVDEYGVIHTAKVAKKTNVNITCKVNGKKLTVKLVVWPNK